MPGYVLTTDAVITRPQPDGMDEVTIITTRAEYDLSGALVAEEESRTRPIIVYPVGRPLNDNEIADIKAVQCG